MKPNTAIQSASKYSLQKYACLVVLNIFTISTLANAQSIENQSTKFQLKNLTTNYSETYLRSIFNDKITDSVQIVALGEVSHGAYEPIAFKGNMARYLIEKKGYRKILFEFSDIGGIAAMRKYLTDRNNTDTTYIPKWVKEGHFVDATSSVFLSLLKWIKHYNGKHPKDMVQVMGFEIGTDQAVINLILNNYMIPYGQKESEKYIEQIKSNITDMEKL